MTYGVEGPNDDRLYRDPRSTRNRKIIEAGAKLSSLLSSIVEVNWISVHRNSIDRSQRYARDDEFDTVIDQKIHEMSKKFASYFSLLSSKASDESKQFQESVFLSLLEAQPRLFREFLLEESDPQEHDSISRVLRDLGVPAAKATKNVNAYYSRLDAAKKLLKDEKGLQQKPLQPSLTRGELSI